MTSRTGKRKRDSTTENDNKDNQRKRRSLPSAKSGSDSAAAALPDAGAGVSTSWCTVSAEIQRLTNLIPKIRNFKLETSEACIHEVAIPEDVEYKELVVSKDPAAREYRFQLDPFQKEAILCIENNQSVLVSAHTSAGKTVVAEYAIALSLRKKQRVIYTTPIKALSNQKYYEMLAEFGDVGLMTGDITINQDATCLIMTTEILRSMLYKGSEVMKEMAWVVFDEIHYMRDKERGVVWEESIILLPDAVRCVFLSATIPNAKQFAEWICYLHKQPCHVVYTDFRPTPLQHYVFPAGGEGLHLVVDESGAFREDNFSAAMSILKDGDAAKGDERGRKGGLRGDSNCFKIVKLVMEKNMAPVIVFSFSKKDCEDYAKQMSKLYFTTSEEEKLVDTVFQNAIDYTLSDDEKELPQVKGILPLLKKGIGIHHSGLLPVLKEVVEILFSEGLIKALFATETFAMGLNMPARTVLFTHARKFDGKDFRWITSGEYIQMSGRAGRRGLDDKGIVILMVDEKMSPSIGKQIIKGQPDPLLSAFRVTYSMVLNLLRIQDINPEYMLEKSFYTFQNYASILEVVQKMEAKESQYKAAMVENEEVVVSYQAIQKQLDRLSMKLAFFIHKPQYILPFLKSGRLVKVISGSRDFGWCVVIGAPQSVKKPKSVEGKGSVSVLEALTETANLWFCEQAPSQSNKTPDKQRANEKVKMETSGRNQEPVYDIEMLVTVSRDTCSEKYFAAMKPSPEGEKGQMILVKVEMESIIEISAIRLEKIPQDLKSPANRAEVHKALQFVHQKFPSGFDLLDPINDMHIKEEEAKKIVSNMEECRTRLKEHPLHSGEQMQRISKQYESKMKIQTDISTLKMELKQHPFFLQIDQLKHRKRVLRRLGYAKLGDVIQLKGHAACEISSGDELLLTELLFNGVFNNLTAEETCSLLSCLVFQEKSSDVVQLSEGMQQILRQMQDVARRVAKVSIDARLPMDEDSYIESFRPDMMEVVNAWCKGSSFSQICEITAIYEGSIIRTMRRLQEALLQMYKASKAIGNAELEIKFCKGIYMIKRNIVNACSLYLPKNF